MIFISSSKEETVEIGERLAEKLLGKVVILSGELGCGKTIFVKGVGKFFGIPEDEITSPTYTIIQEYYSKIIHIDLYKTENFNDIIQYISEKINGDTIVIVEWGEKIEKYFQNTVKISFEVLEDGKRKIEIKGI